MHLEGLSGRGPSIPTLLYRVGWQLESYPRVTKYGPWKWRATLGALPSSVLQNMDDPPWDAMDDHTRFIWAWTRAIGVQHQLHRLAIEIGRSNALDALAMIEGGIAVPSDPYSSFATNTLHTAREYGVDESVALEAYERVWKGRGSWLDEATGEFTFWDEAIEVRSNRSKNEVIRQLAHRAGNLATWQIAVATNFSDASDALRRDAARLPTDQAYNLAIALSSSLWDLGVQDSYTQLGHETWLEPPPGVEPIPVAVEFDEALKAPVDEAMVTILITAWLVFGGIVQSLVRA